MAGCRGIEFDKPGFQARHTFSGHLPSSCTTDLLKAESMSPFSITVWQSGEPLIVTFSLPCALAGGVWLTDFMHFSMNAAVTVGFVALASVAAATRVIRFTGADDEPSLRYLAVLDLVDRNHTDPARPVRKGSSDDLMIDNLVADRCAVDESTV
jgi:hypothetical protein